MVAVHSAGADRDRTSPVMMGLSLKMNDSGTGLVGMATDGKILVEEAWEVFGPFDAAVILPGAAMPVLAAMAKACAAAKCAASLAVDGLQVTLSGTGATQTFRRVEGDIPSYEGCMGKSYMDEHRDDIPNTFGVNLAYAARLARCWPSLGRDDGGRPISVTMGRGLLCRPTTRDPAAFSQRALIMPITLPS